MNNTTRALLSLQALEFTETATSTKAPSRLARAVSRLRGRVSKQILSRYDSRKRRYGANSVVPLKRGICTGCQVSVSRKTRTSSEKGLVECEHCGRLVYSTGRHRPLNLEVWAA